MPDRGELVIVTIDGAEFEATYEFRVTNGEPLGHHSVMLANGAGRRLVCGCALRFELQGEALRGGDA